MAIELNDQNFSQEVKSFSGIVLVDFWAPGCGPCKMQGPIIDNVAKKYEGQSQVKIGKVNVDENQATAQEFQIMSIPTLKIFKNGQVAEEMIGLQSESALAEKINKNLA